MLIQIIPEYYNVWRQEVIIGEHPVHSKGEVPPAKKNGEQVASSAPSTIQRYENVWTRSLRLQGSRRSRWLGWGSQLAHSTMSREGTTRDGDPRRNLERNGRGAGQILSGLMGPKVSLGIWRAAKHTAADCRIHSSQQRKWTGANADEADANG